MFQELSVHQISFQSILGGEKKKKRKRQKSGGLFLDSCCSREVRMVMQFRCCDGLPKCYGQILLLQAWGTRLFPAGIRSTERWSSQPYVVLFAPYHKRGKWKYYRVCKAVITVPCSCSALVETGAEMPLGFWWGQRETSNWPCWCCISLPSCPRRGNANMS